jgi:tRNA(Ile)-lysidine synthase
VIDRVQRVIVEHRLFEGRRKLLLGVSGGADSVFLFHLLTRLAVGQGVSFVVGHVNHQLRGLDSSADEDFVRALAEQAGCTFLVEHVDTATRAAGDCSIEMAARLDRHEAFQAMLRRSGADALVLAHTQSDQAETVILQLCRGSGPDGFTGMAIERRIQEMTILRPLLSFSRNEIRDWLLHEELVWREDSSNDDDCFLRNRVRQEILPRLTDRVNDRAEAHIARAAGDLQAELDFLDQLAETELEQLMNPEGHLSARGLSEMHRALALRVLAKWLIRLSCPPALITAGHLQAIRILCASQQGSARLELGQGRVLERSYNTVFLQQPPAPIPGEQVLQVPAHQVFPDWGLEVVSTEGQGFDRNPAPGPGVYPACVQLSAERLAGRSICLRSWCPGDRFTPLGMQGSRKLQDIFTDFKVAEYRRSRVPVFVVGEEIVYLAGYRIDDAWRVESADHASVRIAVDYL